MNKKLKILYKQCIALKNTIDNARLEQFVRASAFARKYNQLRKKIIEIDKDVEEYTNPIKGYDSIYDPTLEMSMINQVKVELGSLISYLEEQMDKIEEFIIKLINLFKIKLRPIFKEKPSLEKEVQDKVEIMLNVIGYKFLREQITIPFSSKHFIPDFTFENESIALEIKLCNRDRKEKELIDEINGDIKAYKTKYKHIIFIVYDNGYIRNVEKFKEDISNDLDIFIEVIKH